MPYIKSVMIRRGKDTISANNPMNAHISYTLARYTYAYLAPVVQTLDSSTHRINHYPVDKYYESLLRYPPDSNLSGG